MKCWITGNFSRHCEEGGGRAEVRPALHPPRPHRASQGPLHNSGRSEQHSSQRCPSRAQAVGQSQSCPLAFGKDKASFLFPTTPSHPKTPLHDNQIHQIMTMRVRSGSGTGRGRGRGSPTPQSISQEESQVTSRPRGGVGTRGKKKVPHHWGPSSPGPSPGQEVWGHRDTSMRRAQDLFSPIFNSLDGKRHLGTSQ